MRIINILIYVILLLSATGAIIGWHNQKKGIQWGQPLTIACALLAILLGFFQAYVTSVGGLNKNAAAAIRQRAFERSKGIILGRYLKSHYRGQRMLIIKDPTNLQNPEALMAFRRETLKELTTVAIVAPEPKTFNQAPADMPKDFLSYAPVETWYNKKVLEQLLANQEFDILVTCIGMPADLTISGKEFNSHYLKGKRVVILSGPIYDFLRLFISGRLAAAVVPLPDADYELTSVPKDPQAAFDKRYLLVTPENFREMNEKHDVFRR